ncbi:MAG: hypothetical protein ACREGB_05315 [Candidatus Saccharimonadales bacterium]
MSHPNQAPTLEVMPPQLAEAYIEASVVVMSALSPEVIESVQGVHVFNGQGSPHASGSKNPHQLFITGDNVSFTADTSDWVWSGKTEHKLNLKQSISANGTMDAKWVSRRTARAWEQAQYTSGGIYLDREDLKRTPRFGGAAPVSKQEAQDLFVTMATDFKAALSDRLADHPDLLERIEKRADKLANAPTQKLVAVKEKLEPRVHIKPRIARAIGKLAGDKSEH